MNINSQTKLYCLIGNPVSKSLSPNIHNYIFNLNKINATYLTFNVKKKELEYAIKGMKALDVKGFNVTVPYKIEIMKYLDEIDEEAEMLGAVNTVKNENGHLIGYNTDGKGFVTSLENQNVSIKNKSFLILGAGGASHGICMKLAMEGARKIIVLNRTVERAKNLAFYIKKKFKNVIVDYGKLDKEIKKNFNVDVVVNCTTVGMFPNVSNVPINVKQFTENIFICDIIYKPIKTRFLKMAESENHKTLNGINMLINQAILSEKIWLNDINKSLLIKRDILEGLLNHIVE